MAPLVLALISGCASFAFGASDRSALKSAPSSNMFRVRVTDTNDGVELTSTTTPSKVKKVRPRVRDQARVNGPNRHLGQDHDGSTAAS